MKKKKNKGDKAAGENSTTGTFRYCYFRTSGSIRFDMLGTILSTTLFSGTSVLDLVLSEVFCWLYL